MSRNEFLLHPVSTIIVEVTNVKYNALKLFVYYRTNIMIKMYISNETYNLRNSNHHELPALGRSIAGPGVTQYRE
jgi:hypothetical protein